MLSFRMRNILHMVALILCGIVVVVMVSDKIGREKADEGKNQIKNNVLSDSIRWENPNGVYDAVFLVSSNITFQSKSNVHSLEALVELANAFINLPYKNLTPEKIAQSVVKYDELVVYISLGLVKYGATKTDVEDFVIAALDRLQCMEKYLRIRSLSVKQKEKQKHNNAIEVLRRERQGYVKYWGKVGSRFVIGRFGENAEKEFLDKLSAASKLVE